MGHNPIAHGLLKIVLRVLCVLGVPAVRLSRRHLKDHQLKPKDVLGLVGLPDSHAVRFRTRRSDTQNGRGLEHGGQVVIDGLGGFSHAFQVGFHGRAERNANILAGTCHY